MEVLDRNREGDLVAVDCEVLGFVARSHQCGLSSCMVDLRRDDAVLNGRVKSSYPIDGAAMFIEVPLNDDLVLGVRCAPEPV